MGNMPLNKLNINREELAIVRNILDQHLPDRTVWAFGSRVTGKARPYSDLDLAIVDKQPLPLDKMADLVEAFDESDLPFKVDIVDWAKTDEAFREIIKKCKIVLRDRGKLAGESQKL